MAHLPRGRRPRRPRFAPSAARASILVDDSARDFAGVHGGEGFVDLVEAPLAGDELVELEGAGEVEVDQAREVGAGAGRAVEAAAQLALAIDEVLRRDRDERLLRRDPDDYRGAALAG